MSKYRNLKVALLFLAIILLLPTARLLKDVPSIHVTPQPFCEGKKFSFKGKYLSYDQLPPALLDIFKKTYPEYKILISKLLSAEMPRASSMAVHHLRSLLVWGWVQQFKESDLLAFYFNSAYLGNGCYGLDAAVRAYYTKEVSALTDEEIYELMDIIKAPAKYTRY